jgi:small subunit ribosomal protein S5
VRAVVESAGVRDILTKTLGTNNPNNVVNAVLRGLMELRDPEERLAELGRER